MTALKDLPSDSTLQENYHIFQEVIQHGWDCTFQDNLDSELSILDSNGDGYVDVSDYERALANECFGSAATPALYLDQFLDAAQYIKNKFGKKLQVIRPQEKSLHPIKRSYYFGTTASTDDMLLVMTSKHVLEISDLPKPYQKIATIILRAYWSGFVSINYDSYKEIITPFIAEKIFNDKGEKKISSTSYEAFRDIVRNTNLNYTEISLLEFLQFADYLRRQQGYTNLPPTQIDFESHDKAEASNIAHSLIKHGLDKETLAKQKLVNDIYDHILGAVINSLNKICATSNPLNEDDCKKIEKYKDSILLSRDISKRFIEDHPSFASLEALQRMKDFGDKRPDLWDVTDLDKTKGFTKISQIFSAQQPSQSHVYEDLNNQYPELSSFIVDPSNSSSINPQKLTQNFAASFPAVGLFLEKNPSMLENGFDTTTSDTLIFFFTLATMDMHFWDQGMEDIANTVIISSNAANPVPEAVDDDTFDKSSSSPNNTSDNSPNPEFL